jgi:hypothetical protein
MESMHTRTIVVRLIVLAATLAGCAGLNPRQDAGWTAFHECQPAAPSAMLEDLQLAGRVGYMTREGVDFSSMKACMEQRGYVCDIATTASGRPHTHCYPKTS